MVGPATETRSIRKPIAQERLDAARRDLAASGGSAPRRTRTYNPLIKSQLLCQRGGSSKGIQANGLGLVGVSPAHSRRRDFSRFSARLRAIL